MFADVLRQLRKSRRYSQAELSQHLNISPSTVSMYEVGERMPDYDMMKVIANFFNVDINYLYGIEPKNINNQKGCKIPVLGYVAAGIPIEAIEDILDYEELSPDMVKDGSEYFALKIKGHSMEPKFSPGDVVIVRKQPDIESGQIAIVCVNGDHATCKKVMKQANGLLLQPLNPTYEPTFYSAEEVNDLPITILGRVVELRAKF